MNQEIILEAQDISFAYRPKEPILERLNLSIRQGDYLVIIGPNGGGKTTLLKIILGLLKPTSGKILFNPELFQSKDPRRYIGYVPQYIVFDREFPIKVMDVVVMGFLGLRGLFRFYSKKDYKLAEETLNMVNMLAYKDHPINELSGGQLQRVIIARTLVTKPRILLLDEPTTFIDSESQENLSQYLTEWNKDTTIVVVTHDMGIVSKSAKQIACINKKLFYHGGRELPPGIIEETYGCPIDLIGHGIPHRVFKEHNETSTSHKD
ncbi:MAG TPA: ABC transporter ATP-binding protein [Spirochaetes bacterium]|nr:ABC transporter ATP-binding protein [Spirochaetota bacterium]